MNRRIFLKNSAVLLASGFLMRYAHAMAPRKNTWSILHTNDFHSRFLPFAATHKRHANQGGIARLTQLVSELRHQHEHVTLFDSGDVFQGTPYFNVFKGHPELQWMQRMEYDATTLGNHDFDMGVEHVFSLRKQYNTPTLLINYTYEKDSDLGVIKPYKIIEKGPVRIGVTGVSIDLVGLQGETNRGSFAYFDPVEKLQEQVNFLRKNKNCHAVVVLSHLGYQYSSEKIDDIKLAQRTEGIDVILGGHTHTFLDEPTVVKNKAGKKVVINQAGWAGLKLGHLQFEY
jgi:5'-nucleotidase